MKELHEQTCTLFKIKLGLECLKFLPNINNVLKKIFFQLTTIFVQYNVLYNINEFGNMCTFVSHINIWTILNYIKYDWIFLIYM